MDNLDGAIGFKVGLDNSQLASDSAKTKALLRGIGDSGTAQGSRIGTAFNAASGMIGMMALGAVGSIGMLGKTILDTTAKFEKFGIVLKKTLGDAKGADALTMIANFAATTPFQLDEVTGAFIKMANQGFVPTREEMIKLGDLASSTGKSFDQLGEALLDAQTGQFERLKEFGIKASANGDRVTFSFKEQKTTVENTNSAIQKYLLSLGEMKGVAGANEKISASLTGQMSNLGDKMAAMYNQIGTANKGFLYAAVGGASTLIENYETVGETIKVLIGIYGVYKVAVMAVAYGENVKAAAVARNLAIETQYAAIMATKSATTMAMMGKTAASIVMDEAKAAAILHVNAAQMKLDATTKVSMLTNPYVLGAMAVAAMAYAIYKLINMQSDLEKSQQALNDTISETKKTIEAERMEVDALFARLKAAKEQTEEYDAAKAAIFAKYGTQLKHLGDEKDALNDIAKAYKAITDESKKSADARGLAQATGEASQTAAVVTTDAKDKIQKLLQEKYKGQTGADGIGLAETYYARIVPVLDGKEKMTKEMQDLIDSFKTQTTHMTGGVVPQAYTTTSNALQEEFKRVTKAQATLDQTIANATGQFGQAESTAPAAKKINTTYALQIEGLRKEKTRIEKEIAVLKTQEGEDPMKAIIAKQGELDAINKQLGVKATEVKKKEDQIAVTREKMLTATGAELELLAKKLNLLESEKALREGMMESAIAVNKNLAMPTKGASSKSEMMDEIIRASGIDLSKAMVMKAPKVVAPEWDKLNKKIREGEEYQKEVDKDKQERLEKETTLRENILSIAQDVTGQLAAQGMLSQAEAKLIDGTLAAIKTGNLLAMAAQAAGMIISMFPQTAAAKYEEQIQKINQALRDQERLINQASRTGGEREAREKELEILKQKKAADEKALAAAQKKLDDKVFDVGPVYWDRVHKVRDLTQAVKDDQAAIEDAALALSDFLSGGIAQDGIADVIARGFEDGKTSVDDFADYMNDVLMDSAVNIFKTQYLLPDIDKFLTPVITEALKDNKISEVEKANIDKATKFVADKNKAVWDGLTGSLGGSKDDRTGSSKGITSMSQDSADELNGRFTVIQGHTFSINAGVQILAANSAGILKHLAGIKADTGRLEAIEMGIGKMQVGIDTMNLKGITIKK